MNSRACVVLVAAAMAAPSRPTMGQKPDRSATPADTAVRPFLQAYLSRPPFGADSSTRFSAAPINGADGATEEIVVYVSGKQWCGSGGCPLVILAPRGGSYNVMGRVSITWPPIRALGHTTRGRHDIGVWVQGGGIQPGYEAILQFNGTKYPSNPTVPPAIRSSRRPGGDIVIPLDPKLWPLY